MAAASAEATTKRLFMSSSIEKHELPARPIAPDGGHTDSPSLRFGGGHQKVTGAVDWTFVRRLNMTAPTESDELGKLMQAAQGGDADAYLDLLRTITPRIRQIIARQRGFAGPE